MPDDEAILKAQYLFSEAVDEYNFYREVGYGDALDYLNEAQEVAPDWPYSYVLEGYIYYFKRDFATAIQNFNQALDLGASDDPAGYTYFRLGQAFFDSGQVDSAIEPIKSAFERRPNLTFIQRTYIGALGRNRLYAETIELASQFQLIEPEDIGIAQVYWEALKATDEDPVEEVFQQQLIAILATRLTRDFAPGRILCDQSLDEPRRQILLLTICANMYVNLEEYDTARELADALLLLNPDDPYSLMTRARIEVIDENPAAALELYDQAYALNPVNSAIIFRRINAYREAGIELPVEQIQDYFDMHARALWPWLMDESGQTTLPVFAESGYLIEFEGNQGDVFTFTAEVLYLGHAMTPILLIKDDSDTAIAGTMLPIGPDADEYNARLANVELPATGTYTLWVGLGIGGTSVRLTIEKPQ